MNPRPIDPAPAGLRAGVRRQRGAATLAVVMLLFFVVSLAAAYASRNLIFEQRTSANQLRSTQSVEAAEAGIEWAIAMLSSGRIDDDCAQTTDTTRNTFRDRYLTVNATGPNIGVIGRVPNSDGVSLLWAACGLDGTTWRCKCPSGNLSAGDLPAGAAAAFAVRFLPQPNRADVVRIEVNGCNTSDLDCLRTVAVVNNLRCHSTLCSLLGMFSGLKQVPGAALTARQGLSGTALAVYNTDPVSGGITVHTGGDIDPALALTSVSTAGTPGPTSQIADDNLTVNNLGQLAADADGCSSCLFTTTFGLRPETYRRQTAVTPLNCATACSAADVNLALASRRSRIVWLSGAGGLTLASAADVIGAAGDPVVLVVEGPLAMSSSPTVYGSVYAGSVAIDGGRVQGALISANAVTAGGSGQVVYDPAILAQLHYTTGSFVRLPGSWRDFP